MKIKHQQTFCDYREALEKWNSEITATLTSNIDGTYTVIWETESDSYPQLVREYLLDIKLHNDLPKEQIDALAYADSAIKTLIDMGIIK